MAKNKVKFGLKNAHYAVITLDNEGKPTYATPVPWPGSVNFSMDAEGELTPFRADNMNYWVSSSNNGYTGELETALIPKTFRTDVLGEEEDANGVLIEKSTAIPKDFAFLFQVEGDQAATRFVLYNCTATRPSTEASTTEEAIEPQTDTVSMQASPRYDGIVKATAEAGTSPYDTWFESVYEPATTGGGTTGGETTGGETTGDKGEGNGEG